MFGRRGRPPRSRLVLPVTVVGLAAVVFVWLSSSVELGDTAQVRSEMPAVSVERDDGRIWRIVRFRPESLVELETTIVHRGLLPVDVVGIEQTRRRAPTGHCGWWPTRTVVNGQEPRPQAPVRLPRNAQTTVVITGTLEGGEDCLSADAAQWQDRVRIETRVAGMGRTVTTLLPTVIVWASDPSATAARFETSPVAPRVGTAP